MSAPTSSSSDDDVSADVVSVCGLSGAFRSNRCPVCGGAGWGGWGGWREECGGVPSGAFQTLFILHTHIHILKRYIFASVYANHDPQFHAL